MKFSPSLIAEAKLTKKRWNEEACNLLRNEFHHFLHNKTYPGYKDIRILQKSIHRVLQTDLKLRSSPNLLTSEIKWLSTYRQLHTCILPTLSS